MSPEYIRQLRPLSALQLLTIFRECRESIPDPLERSLCSNARVLAACCFREDGTEAFPDAEAVLAALTARQMEELLYCLAGTEAPAEQNETFDMERFVQLGGA